MMLRWPTCVMDIGYDTLSLWLWFLSWHCQRLFWWLYDVRMVAFFRIDEFFQDCPGWIWWLRWFTWWPLFFAWLSRKVMMMVMMMRMMTFVCFCMAVQKGSYSRMHGESKKVEHLDKQMSKYPLLYIFLHLSVLLWRFLKAHLLSVFNWVHTEVLISKSPARMC